jgi:Rap1a immunity proteins
MRLFIVAFAALAAVLRIMPARAEDMHSGNYMLPKCEAYLGLKDRDSLQKEIERGNADTSAGTGAMHFMELGRCMGEVVGIADILTMSDGRAFSACPPIEATPGQILNVVVTTLKQNPAELHENFAILVIAALRTAWPCQK